MKKSVLSAVVVVLVVFSLAQVARAQTDFGIDIAPRVLNVNSTGNRLVVHTDISYDFFSECRVFLSWIGKEGDLNSLEPLEVKADVSGNLMAKFSAQVVKEDIPTGPAVSMSLTIENADFSLTGTDTIRVIKRGGRRGGPGQ